MIEHIDKYNQLLVNLQLKMFVVSVLYEFFYIKQKFQCFLYQYTCEKYTDIIRKVHLQITHTGTLVKSVPVLKKIENKSLLVKLT
jgi:hypothetical protein